MSETENKELNENNDNEALDLEQVRIEIGAGKRSHRHRKRRKKKKLTTKQKVTGGLLCILSIVILIGACICYSFVSGKSDIKKESITVPVMADEQEDSISQVELASNVDTPHWKESMINILLIGVDSKGEKDDAKIQGSGNGQSDVILLVSLDTDTHQLTVLPINRDTMTDITVIDQAGNNRGKREAQLALSYSYGRDNEESVKLTAQAVSSIMHGLPIHGFLTINISAIPIVNDAVGGIEVTLTEDFVEEWGDRYVKGSKVFLQGDMAETYIRARMNKKDPTNAARMGRHKGYLMALAHKVIDQSKMNPTLPISLYRKLQPYMTTNIKLNEFAYLASEAIQCEFSEECIRSIEGTADDSGKYMEFRVDEEKLSDLIREIYYEEVP